MQFDFSNISTQYSQTNADVIASITKENTNAANSNIDSAYNSSALNLDAAVLSISTEGNARINAMLSKSIQLRATSFDPAMTASDRREVSNELRELRREIDEIRSEDRSKKVSKSETKQTEAANKNTEAADVSMSSADAEKMMAESTNNILKHADESIQSQVLDRERILQLL